MEEVIIQQGVLSTVTTLSPSVDDTVQFWLIGYFSSSVPVVLCCIRRLKKSLEEENVVLSTLLPKGVSVVGVGIFADSSQSHKERIQSRVCGSLGHSIITNDSYLVSVIETQENKPKQVLFFSVKSKEVKQIDKITEDSQATKQFHSTHYLFHTSLSLSFYLSGDKKTHQNELEKQIETYCSTSLLPETTYLLFEQSNQVFGITSNSQSSCEETFKPPSSKKSNDSTPSSRRSDPEIISSTVFQKRSTPKKESPVICYSHTGEVTLQQVQMNVSVVCYVPMESPLSSALQLLYDSIIARLKLMSAYVTASSQIGCYHFLPFKYPHVISVIYPLTGSDANTDEILIEVRRELHSRLCLPLDRPLLRISNALSFAPTAAVTSKTERLRDVHLSIAPNAQVPGGKQYLVEGSYDYYHYMQDNMNDNGWGCAYRSMQTLCSWLKLQHYTSKEVPSIIDIQKTLVEIGDKPKSFINTSNWIGAIEIGLCLQHLYGIQYSIMHLSSGAELANKGRELALHFERQGSPVMIGGGVLAYTLLGIDFNEKTGEIKFLILDPHYTGSENIKTIKEKGWCGWKSVDLFRKDSFYNLCLPQRPQQI